jgi:predicted enzyme related to lactoylglutathione lyase
MKNLASTFSSFSTDDLTKTKQFYQETMGISVTERPEGLELLDGTVFIYPKADHSPATFTVLNFVVADIDEAVDELIAKGVQMEQYNIPELKTDEKGVCRNDGSHLGPKALAWFKDPASNILALIQEK